MHNIENLNTGIAEIIKGVFNVQVIAQEIETPEYIPAAKIVLDNVQTTRINADFFERTTSFIIIYYPKNKSKYKAECLMFLQKLEAYFLFFGIKTPKGDKIPVDSVSIEIDKGIGGLLFEIHENSTELCSLEGYKTPEQNGSDEYMEEIKGEDLCK